MSTPFVNAADQAGVRFSCGHPDGVLTILDTSGSGCGFLDYDRDGNQDLLLIARDQCKLFRNSGNGTFTDVTEALGLPQHGYWIGCAVADYDNDGYPDIFLNGYGVVCLLHNDGGKRFTDVTTAAGLAGAARGPDGAPSWGVSAAWSDVDRDGWPDLYVGRYAVFGPHTPQLCKSAEGVQLTCRPQHYANQKGSLYRNIGGKRFQDVTAAMGADQIHGKTWGVTFLDFNEDGWPDLYLANDEEPGDLLQNQKGKRFRNVGIAAGAALDADGRPHGGMGVDAGDYNGDGHPDLVVTTYAKEPFSLYRNNNDGTFSDVSTPAGIGFPSLPMVGWAAKMIDYDNDGALDLLFVNGAVTNSEQTPHPKEAMAQPMALFQNKGAFFSPVPLGTVGEHLVGRGAAFGDYDNDGFTDVLVMDMEGSALLLHNENAKIQPAHHWVGLSLVGGRSNRSALGARVSLRAGGRTQVAEVQTSGGVFSSNDPRLRFGLGANAAVDEVAIRWPSGIQDRLTGIPLDRYTEIHEGQSRGSGASTGPAAVRRHAP